MTKERFLYLYHIAKEQPNLPLYIGEFGYPDYFDEISTDPDEVVKRLTEIHDLAHMSMSDIIKASPYSTGGFAKHFDIPLRTVQHWVLADRPCPEYIKLMVAELLGLIKIK